MLVYTLYLVSGCSASVHLVSCVLTLVLVYTLYLVSGCSASVHFVSRIRV